MMATSMTNESLILMLAPVSFIRSSFSKSFLIIVITSTPRVDSSFSISSTVECLENQGFVAEIMTERLAWIDHEKTHLGMCVH